MAKSSLALFLAALLLFAAAAAPAMAQGGGGGGGGGGGNNGGGATASSNNNNNNNNAGAGQQKLSAEQCRQALQSAGGESALLARAPSCSTAATSTVAAETAGLPTGSSAAPGAGQLQKCCDDLKAAVNAEARIQPCACQQSVWNEAKTRIAEAGLRGVDASSVEAFAKGCGLKFAGNGC